MNYGTPQMKLRSIFVVSDESRDGVVSMDELTAMLTFGFRLAHRADEAFCGQNYVLTEEQQALVREAAQKLMDEIDEDKVCCCRFDMGERTKF